MAALLVPLVGVFESPVINRLLNYIFQRLPGSRRLELNQDRIEYGTREEQTLNLFLVGETFMQLFATGFGFLSSIWATVVLLRLEKEDFWFVTIIILIQSVRILGFNRQYPEARFFSEVPQVYKDSHFKKWVKSGHSKSAKGPTLTYAIKKFLNLVTILAWAAFLIAVAPAAAILICITLPIIRLVALAGNVYGGDSTDASKVNLKPALIFFYALVLTQGAFMFLYLIIWVERQEAARSMRRKCGFVKNKWGLNKHEAKKLVDRYIENTLDSCIEAGFSKTFKRNLVSFAQDLLRNDADDDHSTAVLILYILMAQDAHCDRAISQMQSSKQCIVRLFEILSPKSLADKKIKKYTAAVVTKLASNMQLADVSGAIQSISCTLNHGQQRRDDNTRVPNEPSESQITWAMKIVGRLASVPDNCSEMYNNEGLLSKIIEPLCKCNSFYFAVKGVPASTEIIKESLRVVTKIISENDEIRTKIKGRIFNGARCIKEMLTDITDSESETLLISIVSTLAQEEAMRGDFQCTADFIHELLSLCFGDTDSDRLPIIWKMVLLFFESEEVSMAAGYTLSALTRSWDNCRMIMNAQTTLLDRLSDMLDTATIRIHRTLVAQMLSNFCAHSTEVERRILQPLSTKFTMVLRVIADVVPETVEVQVDLVENWNLYRRLRRHHRENLENQVDHDERVLQVIADVLPEAVEVQVDLDENQNLNRRIKPDETKLTAAVLSLATHMIAAGLLPEGEVQIPIRNDRFVEKLKEIVERNSEPTPDCVDIISAVAKLCIEIMTRNPSTIGAFHEKGIVEVLIIAAKNMSELEWCMITTGRIAITAEYKTVPSIVEKVKELVDSAPGQQP